LEKPVYVSFKPDRHRLWLKFSLFDERGNRVGLPAIQPPEVLRGSAEVRPIKAGETITGYLSPKCDYKIRPGRYLVKVAYYLEVPDTGVERKVESNQIAKTFPAALPLP
jgi:hypothetical protein